MTPGRMNVFNFHNFTVMLDYAHNAHGMNAIGKFVKKVEATKKVGVIAGVGDRRDEDTIALGEQAAMVFDEIIIRQDKNLRGRTEEDIIALITKGVHNIDPNKKITVIKKETEAIDYAVSSADPGSFIVVISDVVPSALEQVMRLKEEEDSNGSFVKANHMTDYVI
jgi:cyanophycin synthetase